MGGRTNGISQIPVDTSVTGRNRGVQGLQNAAEALNRHVREFCASKISRQPEADAVGPEQKPLFSRKIVWLEKIKLHMKIIGCSVRLSLHLYLDQQGRAAIKKSKKDAKLDLQTLINKENMQRNAKKVQEDLQDGQYVDAAQGTVKVVTDTCKYLWSKLRNPGAVIN